MRTAFLLTTLALACSAQCVAPWSTRGSSSFAQDASGVRTVLQNELDNPGYPENVGLGKYLKARVPTRAELPELDRSPFWSYFYAYDYLSYWYARNSTDGNRPYAAGYQIDLLKSRSCKTQTADCDGGGIFGRVNSPDKRFIYNFDNIDGNPIPNTNQLELAYGKRGYLNHEWIEWLDGGGKYGLNLGSSALELVLLANAANMDLKSKTGPNTRQTLLGKVGNSSANMLLRRSGSWLWGTYYYDRGKTPAITDRLYVVGEVKNGRFQLREYDLSGYPDKLPPGNTVPTSAVWSGTLNDQGVLRGTVTNAKTKKAFPASLQPQK